MNRQVVLSALAGAFFSLISSAPVQACWCGQPFPVLPVMPDPPAAPPPPVCSPPAASGTGHAETCPYCTCSPNYAASGVFAFGDTDLVVPTAGLPITVSRTYNTAGIQDWPLGTGWSSSLRSRVFQTSFLVSAPSTTQQMAVVTMPDGERLSFTRAPDGTFTPPPGRRHTLTQVGDGSYTLTLARTGTRYAYSATGALQSATDEHGNSLTYTYDASGRLQRIADASGSGRYLDVYWGADGRVSGVQDSGGRQVSYGYDAGGTLTTVTDPAGRQTRYSYVQGRFGKLLSDVKDHWNRPITHVTYDTQDRTLNYTEAGETFTYAYNYQGDSAKVSKTSTLNTSGTPWVHAFNTQGLVVSSAAPAGGGTTTRQFDASGNILSSTDASGVTTSYTYNADDTVASVTQDAQGAAAVRYDYTYDPAFPGKVTAVTPKNPSTNAVHPGWQAWRYDHYQAGSPAPGALFHVYRVRSDGTTLDTVATYEYDSHGRVTRQTNASGGSTDYSYDASGNLQTVTGPANNALGTRPVTAYGYDSLGRVSSATDPLGHQTGYTYDGLGRVLTVTLPKPEVGSPLSFVTTYSYDNHDAATGLVFTHVTDPNGKLTKLGYDQFGRLVKSIDAAGAATAYTYDRNVLQSITDANGNVTSYQYDSLGRLTRTTFPDGAYESYAYRADGLLQTRTPRAGAAVTYAYDSFKRLTSKTYASAGSITYTYQGQALTQVVDTSVNPGEAHTFTYDTAYRLVTNVQGPRGTLAYSYGADDRVATMGIASGPTATYDYYPDRSLRTIDWSPQAGSFQYQYNLAGQYQLVTLPNGQSRQYAYDDQGRLLQLTNALGATNLATYAYGYDLNNQTGTYTMLGQRTSQTATVPAQGFSGALTKYSYDALYQLTRADYPAVSPFNGEIASWTYDSIGNRLTDTVNGSTQTYGYFKNSGNPLNTQRLQTDGSSTYAYNAAGAVSGITGGSSYSLAYDNEMRLTSISGATAATYTYDYQGRRTSKTVGGVTTTYLYDGVNPVAEIVGGAPRYYLNGPGIDEPLAAYAGGAMTYLTSDALGSVVLEGDPSATVTRSTIFDAWGGVRSETGTRATSFTYTGREVGEAGFHFYRARYYQPSIGRFQQEDPLQIGRLRSPGASRASDLFAYVENAPAELTDPLGLRHTKRPTPTPTPPPPRTPDVTIDVTCAGWLEASIKTALNTAIGRQDCMPRRFVNAWPTGKTLRIACGAFADTTCATERGGNNTVTLYAKAFWPPEAGGGCGCLEATIFHELVHWGGGSEPQAYGCAKKCFACAQQIGNCSDCK